jgi:hypothetical protein
MNRVLRSFQYFLLLSIALFLLGCAPRCDNASGDECLRVLFVGNSYTYVNDLPNTFAQLARSGNHLVEVDIVAEGGFSLTDHLASSNFSSKLTSSQWNYVVLQEQSSTPAVEAWRTQSMYPAARSMAQQIRANNAQPIFFETWAHKGGLPDAGIPDYESMQYEVNQGYVRIARELNAPVAQVGSAWFRAINKYPQLQLWQEDGSHPTEQGTYLAACVFYVTFFHQSPVGLKYHGNLSADVAAQLQEAANTLLVNP